MSVENTPVLIVGGGLVGLSAAVFLAHRNTPVVLIDQYPGSSPHPRAVGYTERTMEHLREVGLGGKVQEVPEGWKLRRMRIESLAGRWIEELQFTPGGKPVQPRQYSPCVSAALAQDRLEPILRDRAVELGADIRLSTKLTAITQDDDGVTASLQRSDGSEYTLRALYVIAADGAASFLRDELGIARSGRGFIRTIRSFLFSADLDEYLKSGIVQFEIDQPDLKAFLTTYLDGRWLFQLPSEESFTEAVLTDMAYRAIGRRDRPITPIVVGDWPMQALIANTFRVGRIFLAGDAAHSFPPARGGYGANTGIDDVHNFAWKLTAVLEGHARPALLNSYDAERRPIAWLRHNQIFARPDQGRWGGARTEGVEILDEAAIELGQIYLSEAVMGEYKGEVTAKRPDEWDGEPGIRAPHLWVMRDGHRVSLLDCFYKSWIVLTEDSRWCEAARQTAERLGMPIKSLQVGVDIKLDDNGELERLYGITSAGASLIRPDGHIGWRSRGAVPDAGGVLVDVLMKIAAATPRQGAGSAG
jgi:2-polyprenyl-6-methoxyphenol hydroxylase-like FAD-dependent oxidoreductase